MSVDTPKVWRINIKTDAVPGVDPWLFCLNGGFLGVGWRAGGSESLDWDRYLADAEIKYREENGWWPAVNAIRNRMSEGDLCWSRDHSGIYYLARITGPWRYIGDSEHLDADVVNVRDCDWLRVGPEDAVPGKVVNSFRPARTLQRVIDDTIVTFSSYLFGKHFDSASPYQPHELSPNVYSLLSSEDCEDLVALYMQTKGFLLMPSTCKKSTMHYEWVMRHKDDGRRAAAQVKNGNVDLNQEEYSEFPGDVFLFTTNGSYIGQAESNVHCISPKALMAFMKKKRSCLPERIQLWLEISERLGRPGGLRFS